MREECVQQGAAQARMLDADAVLTSKYWGPQPRRLTVSFMEQTAPELRRRILSHMNAWTRTSGIEFTDIGVSDRGSATASSRRRERGRIVMCVRRILRSLARSLPPARLRSRGGSSGGRSASVIE